MTDLTTCCAFAHRLKKRSNLQQPVLTSAFKNETIRPILKLQNPPHSWRYFTIILKRKGVFYDLGVEKLAYIENSLIKDQKFRNSLKGVIIGQFTLDEYQTVASIHHRLINV